MNRHLSIYIETTMPDTDPPELDVNNIYVKATPTNPEAPNGETYVEISFRMKDNISGPQQAVLAHVKSKCYFFKVMLECYLWTFQYNLSWMKKKLKRGCWIISTLKDCVAQNAKRAWRRHASCERGGGTQVP